MLANSSEPGITNSPSDAVASDASDSLHPAST
jgi:hypothetical protein